MTVAINKKDFKIILKRDTITAYRLELKELETKNKNLDLKVDTLET